MPISPNSVRKLLTELGYSRQANRKADEGSHHPDRNAQFEYIKALFGHDVGACFFPAELSRRWL